MNDETMDKFQDKYRIASARLPNWDYRWAAAYFVTICTQNREHYFGEIANEQMQLSHAGVIADVLWHQIPHHAQNIELGAFVVMPNHIHGILIINGHVDNGHHVETLHATSLPPSHPQTATANPDHQINEQMSKISPKSNSISTIIRSYKSAVSKHAHRLGLALQWQARFHDHIIRDDQVFQRISAYILNNPLCWDKDTFFNQE
jgi:putative transposase